MLLHERQNEMAWPDIPAGRLGAEGGRGRTAAATSREQRAASSKQQAASSKPRAASSSEPLL
jgi:hypothetical protein